MKNSSVNWKNIGLLLIGFSILLAFYLGVQISVSGQINDSIAELEVNPVAQTVAGINPPQNNSNFIPPQLPPEIDPINPAQLPVLKDAGISSNLNPFTFQGTQPAVTYTTYIVQHGDVPNSIAEKFGIEATTLLGGNPSLSDEANLLQAEQEIIILPIDGVLYDVRRGDTIELIAEKYDVPLENIVAYKANNLEFPYRLFEGTQIMVPGAIREVFVWEPPTFTSSASGGGGFGIAPKVRGTGTFIWPVTGRRLTQYYHAFHRGIDVGLAEGNSVVASDTGTVIWAQWNNSGYGGLIVIDHGNGYQTFYGHLSGYNVVAGQVVNQGNLIGFSGNTGRSSGPHIHFEIRLNGVQQDPFWPGYLN